MNSGIYFISGKSECSQLGQLNDCYNMLLLKSIKSARWMSVHMKSVVEQGFSTNSRSTTKRLKQSLNFESGENVRTSSNSNSNFVTWLSVTVSR